VLISASRLSTVEGASKARTHRRAEHTTQYATSRKGCMSYVAPRLHLLQTAVTTLKNLGVSGVSVSDSRQINIPASTTLKALSIVMFPSSKMKKISQIIENRYIDEDKLLDVCMHKFGLGNYRLRVGLPSVLIEVFISDPPLVQVQQMVSRSAFASR
jgi:hypothetical protein